MVNVKYIEMGGNSREWSNWRIVLNPMAWAFCGIRDVASGNVDGRMTMGIGVLKTGVLQVNEPTEMAVLKVFDERPMLPVSITASIIGAALRSGTEELLARWDLMLLWNQDHTMPGGHDFHVFYKAQIDTERSLDGFARISEGAMTANISDLLARNLP